ncbi:MAG: signal peptide peptidase SppA [Candidatus Bipolaricaulota bacterium]|nr:signal peptide peptidase SppA [Candidatus Bipolaricaulota bacterium]MDW8030493.1 signal peptide peptidase SppA [Candidatus Bipolaricaulota bacterium]
MRGRRILWIILIFVAVYVIWVAAQQIALGMRPKVVLARLSGPISESLDTGLFGGGGITPAQVEGMLKRAERDPSVKALVFRIDSPGGTVAASQAIAESIKRFKERTKKPVVVSMGDVAASGGYYISLFADKIIAHPGTTTGSIGVITVFFSLEELLKNLGIQAEIFKSGAYKDVGLGLRPLTDEERALVQQYIDEFYEQFVNAVAEGRKLSVERVRELATGQPYTGAQALQLGLIDQLGSLEDALQTARDLAGVPNAEVIEYRPPAPGLLELLFGRGSATNTVLSELKPELVYLLRVLEGWHAVPRYGN